MKSAQAYGVDAGLTSAAVRVIGNDGPIAVDGLDREDMPIPPGSHAGGGRRRLEDPPIRRQVQIRNDSPENVQAGSAAAKFMRAAIWPSPDYSLGGPDRFPVRRGGFGQGRPGIDFGRYGAMAGRSMAFRLTAGRPASAGGLVWWAGPRPSDVAVVVVNVGTGLGRFRWILPGVRWGGQGGDRYGRSGKDEFLVHCRFCLVVNGRLRETKARVERARQSGAGR